MGTNRVWHMGRMGVRLVRLACAESTNAFLPKSKAHPVRAPLWWLSASSMGSMAIASGGGGGGSAVDGKQREAARIKSEPSGGGEGAVRRSPIVAGVSPCLTSEEKARESTFCSAQ